MIELIDISKTYITGDKKLTVIESLTKIFQTGKLIAVLGPSGIGKSTLLHLLAGLDTPTRGVVNFTFADKKICISKLSQDEAALFRAKNIGFIFQFHHLLPEFSAAENVAMPLRIAGVDAAQSISRAKEILSEVGLSDRADHLPRELSGGEQQRVAIARAIVNNPAFLLADEPTGNLDAATAGTVTELLLNTCKARGITGVIVTHSSELAGRLDLQCRMQAGGSIV